MWRISFWLFFSIGYIIINNSIKADFNPYRPNRLHFLPYFNPRSPCGERPMSTLSLNSSLDFNPRSPCGERPRTWHTITPKQPFQSTLPVRGATICVSIPYGLTNISIHAPRAARALDRRWLPTRAPQFNPPSPCGERQ